MPKRHIQEACGGVVAHLQGLTVDADRPVSVVALLHMQHGHELREVVAPVHVPGRGVAATVHLELEEVQACVPRRRTPVFSQRIRRHVRLTSPRPLRTPLHHP